MLSLIYQEHKNKKVQMHNANGSIAMSYTTEVTCLVLYYKVSGENAYHRPLIWDREGSFLLCKRD